MTTKLYFLELRFFVNMYLHLISIKFNLKVNYKYDNIFKKLGIYFNDGKNIYNNNLLITENNYLEINISGKDVNYIILNTIRYPLAKKY